MRLTTPTGLAIRALLSIAILVTVLAVSIAFVGGIIGAALMYFVPKQGKMQLWIAAFSLGIVVMLPIFAWTIQKTIREERRQLLEKTVPITESTLEDAALTEASVRRVAAQFDVPVPDLRIHSTSAPLAYTTYRPEDANIWTKDRHTPVVIISEGLITLLSQEECEAVLAHELAHIANDDLRLVSGLLVPLIAAESLYEEGYPANVFDIVGRILTVIALVGVGVFTRGRELAADRGAVAATGQAETLATALKRLDESKSDKPMTDLRKHARSTNAVNAFPTLGQGSNTFRLLSTHPSIDVRIKQLQSLT
ncbi:M48 family metallopeptidase [Natrinema halophilum]|uniref:M48 family metalloprotease n=1 Tax=Natrinema halophilum TaxID=1699371 RepID=A0A7D5GFS7_9EURY|nr:M48 family metalloprotease [Natrinema halophilum]QLG47834.1 M48 family metalloprotease [Natrinema halophilum]